jgi:hypothetical protein
LDTWENSTAGPDSDVVDTKGIVVSSRVSRPSVGPRSP